MIAPWTQQDRSGSLWPRPMYDKPTMRMSESLVGSCDTFMIFYGLLKHINSKCFTQSPATFVSVFFLLHCWWVTSLGCLRCHILSSPAPKATFQPNQCHWQHLGNTSSSKIILGNGWQSMTPWPWHSPLETILNQLQRRSTPFSASAHVQGLRSLLLTPPASDSLVLGSDVGFDRFFDDRPRPLVGPRFAKGGRASSCSANWSLVPVSLSIRAFKSCKTRMVANFSRESKSQYMPVGLAGCRALSTWMVCVGVTMMSTGTSCFIRFFPLGGKFSVITWLSWTVVITGVFSSIIPNCLIMPYSSSAKPSPFPTRIPVSGFTADEPITTTSIFVRSSKSMGSANCFIPPAVAANWYFSGGTLPGRIREKKPVRSRGCGT